MKRECDESSKSEDSDRKITCTYCAKAFETEKYLNQHMQVHFAKHQCDICKKTFSFSNNLLTHKKNIHGVLPKKTFSSTLFTCDICNKSFGKKYNLVRHRACVHQQVTPRDVAIRYPCRHCDAIFQNYDSLFRHIEVNHPLNQHGGRQVIPSKKLKNDEDIKDDVKSDNFVTVGNRARPIDQVKQTPNDRAQEDQSALNRNVQNRYISPKQNERYDVLTFFSNIRNEIVTFLKSQVRRLRGIKWNLCFQVELQRDDGTEARRSSPYFRSRTYITLSLEDINDHNLNEAFQKMYASFEKYMKDGSGWFVREVLKLEIHTVVYRPLSGSSYIPLPSTIARSNSVVNIVNNDDKCFLYSVLASLHPTNEHPEHVEQYYQYEHELNMTEISYPVTLPMIYKFEKLNENISVNVFTFENNCILPMRVTEFRHRLHHVNLLWLKTLETSHYCLIKDLNRFLSRTKTCKNKQYFCPYCLHGFIREDLLKNHQSNCSKHGPQKVQLPSEKESILSFADYQKTLKVPFVIYADFETVNTKIHTCAPNPNSSSTTPTTKLEVCGYGYKVVSEDERYTKPTVVYRGPDAAQHLINSLLKEQEEIDSILSNIQPLVLDSDHQTLIQNSTQCCLCKKNFDSDEKSSETRVLHHNHLTGKFIGLACNVCNLQCKQAKFTCVIFHNLKNFDAHILFQVLGQFKDHKLTCIAQNSERYVGFTLGQLRFLDSFQFLPSSLETLARNLKQDGLNAFQHLLSEFSPEHAELLSRKGVYPYDYMDSFERFNEQQLPSREEFYSSVKKEGITEEDYLHAQNIFREFRIKTLGDYHDLYLKTDVLLLSDVFEAFRTVCMSQYELDCCHFYTSPGLSWASLLKMTGVQLELVTDIDQMLMIESGIRGGISQISKRYKKANNPHLENYDPREMKTFLQYLDANNLYGWAMIQPLPIGEFRFLKDIEHFDIMSVPEAGDTGYILEVSLQYPSNLHDKHNCLPLAPEQRQIDVHQLSPYAQHLLRKLYNLSKADPLPSRGRCGKLLTTLYDKDHYILHYRNLQLYLRLGMKIKTIHRILQFRQMAWMKPYIDFNTQKRKEATSTFTKDFYKLMNVSVFGKTMENVRHHKNILLVNREDQLVKLTAKPTYKTCTIFNEDLVAMEFLRSKVKLNKPSYSGMCILDLSKYLMYDFWYNYIKIKYPKAELLMTDTDSLLFACNTNDIYEDMYSSIHLFDTSDYPEDHFLHSNHNKKKLGVMKDETNGVPIQEFVGLRAKMYSFMCNKKEQKRAKGIAKVTVQKELKHNHYKDVLLGETRKVSSMSVLRSHAHELFCETIQKIGLSAFDDKRYMINSVESFAYGHCRIDNPGIAHLDVSDHVNEVLFEENNTFKSLDRPYYKTSDEQCFFLDGVKVTPCVLKDTI